MINHPMHPGVFIGKFPVVIIFVVKQLLAHLEEMAEIIPLVRGKLIERRIIQYGAEFSRRTFCTRTHYAGRPCLTSTGRKFRREVFPCDVEFLVAPWDVDLFKIRTHAVVAHLKNTDCNFATHGLGYRQFNSLLSNARLCPKTLQHLSISFDTHKRSRIAVTASPHRNKSFPDFHEGFFENDGKWLFDFVCDGLGIENANIAPRRNRTAKAVLCVHDGAVQTGGKFCRNRGNAGCGAVFRSGVERNRGNRIIFRPFTRR
ncbi:MAG: hypothetical protein LBM04_01025 [Opitutaceae bacterium]|nr:hypothetical protein [Opitutaceae bacterium]